MGIPTIHVGCKVFGRSRLKALIECGSLEPAACVDIDVEGARESILSLGGSVAETLAERVYGTIAEALRRHPAEVCLVYASTAAHAALVVESLGLGLHTLCVKPIAVTRDEMRRIVAAHAERPGLLLAQGQNKRWNPAAAKMREWLREPHGIGEMLGGECRFSMRLDLRTEGRFDALTEGLFFHAAASHQLDQLVAAKGLPDYVTARTHTVRDDEVGQVGVAGTAGGQALMEYANGALFCYTGTRAGHVNEPFAGWSGHWEFHGVKGNIRRDAGRLRLYRKGTCVENLSLQDIHTDMVADEVLQLDAFARAITTGEGRGWMHDSTLATWVLMEACNESARTGTRVDVRAMRADVLGRGPISESLPPQGEG